MNLKILTVDDCYSKGATLAPVGART